MLIFLLLRRLRKAFRWRQKCGKDIAFPVPHKVLPFAIIKHHSSINTILDKLECVKYNGGVVHKGPPILDGISDELRPFTVGGHFSIDKLL